MALFRQLFDALLRVMFGHNLVDNAREVKDAHTKARASRAEVDAIIRESDQSQ